MASLSPTVLVDADLTAFLHHIIENHAYVSTIVVCMSRSTFMQRLQQTSSDQLNTEATQIRHDGYALPEHSPADGVQPNTVSTAKQWTTPTLRVLASSQNINVAFCEDITNLRAYVATYVYHFNERTQGQFRTASGERSPLLAICNLIELHRSTSAFSAQGISRTFSAVIEAADRCGSRLVIAECNPGNAVNVANHLQPGAEGTANASEHVYDPWEEEIPVLNATTKTFGRGNRAWIGRTIKIRSVAERWCSFGAPRRSRG